MNKEQINPMVSIITPTYNAESFIIDTIESVRQQNYSNWEMIVIDDHSKDNTVKTVKEMMSQEPRIRLIERSKNEGPARTRNAGLREAKGRYIAFLDSDDQWLPNKLASQIAFMQSTGAALSYTSYNRIQLHADGRKEIKPVIVPETVSYKQLLKKNVIGCLTVMIDQDQTGPIQMADIRSRQDYALWLDLTRRGFTALGIPKPLANYRVRVDSLSSNKLKMAKQNWRVYRDIEKLSLPVAIWYFIHYAILKSWEYVHYIK
ncbi:glycosyltransferase [Amphibacillus sp. MSJ-3]|uniref:glycosyltransferase family 2 protein n=1 Tax=Amphibacillus sp. MSJ-3 TaxID=2841505 RepID=UPI001C0F31FB|nr:glycosyltransferase family 2 protein [Amphibacillus sp. MSJ-3]MBU5594364.1 glycosyltransferase [Amphibacillus sp. MSJ-3]